MLHFIFGDLTIKSLSFLYVPILMATFVVVAIGGAAVLALITYSKKWGLGWGGLWRDWVCSVDHKKVGIMYMVLGIVALFRGFSDAILMRSQQAVAVGAHMGYLPPEHYNQIFTAHGVIMIFFFAMSFVFFLANYFVPLQIGARDVAFPFLNSLSFWCAAGGFIIIMISLFIGDFAQTGWLAYPPLSEMQYSPDVGVDYYLWALTISGFGTLLGGLNILVTIVKMRCPGMTLMRMPLFTWSVFCAVILIVIAFPVLNITLGMLFFDRFFGTHLFTSGMGGNAMLYINLIWVWGHPEVYILVLPAFGIFSEVVATFSRKSLFGYAAMVWATVAITFLSFTVWLHHFFTMGSGADVNSFFGIATAMISIPTGVKIFNWLATMYRGRIQFTTPMMWTLAFLITFTVGGMTGVLLAVPGVDFQMHNSVFLVAHFHNTIIGGVVFGMFAGLTYWWPKIFGFKLSEAWGKAAFWCWVPGFYLAFMPLYALGFMGMTRRLNHYSVASGFHPFLIVAALGALLIAIGILFQVIQVAYSIKNRDKLRVGNDPWDARTLEWSMPSPTPFYNFALTPKVDSIDDFWRKKQAGLNQEKPHYTDIHMPKSTCAGFLVAVFGSAFCFAMIWHIWWLAAVGGLGMLVTIIARTFNFDIDYYVPAAEVEKIETEALAGAKS